MLGKKALPWLKGVAQESGETEDSGTHRGMVGVEPMDCRIPECYCFLQWYCSFAHMHQNLHRNNSVFRHVLARLHLPAGSLEGQARVGLQ